MLGITRWTVALCISVKCLSAQVTIWQENFDNPATWANWVRENAPGSRTNPTPVIDGLVYTGGNIPINEPCNNYWVINNNHTPFLTTNTNGISAYRSRNIKCDPNGPAADNYSLHITFKECSRRATGAYPVPPLDELDANEGDGYSWNDGPHNPNDNFPYLSASDQFVYYNANINTTGHCKLRLSFLVYVGGDSTGGIDPSPLTDRSVLYSPDGGATWKVLIADIQNNTFFPAIRQRPEITCQPWMYAGVFLPAECANNPNLRLAFRWRNDNISNMSSQQYTHGTAFNVDNLVIEALPFEPLAVSDLSQACVNQTVTFGNASNNYIPETFSVEWLLPAGASFVGGTSASDQVVRVRFANPGNQTVTLRVTACNGAFSTASVPVNVVACTPEPAFYADFSQICSTNPPPIAGAPTVVTLTNQTNFPAAYTPQWTFVPNTVTFLNATNANSPNPQVSFNGEGTYTVRLTINSPGNNPAFTEQTITVANCECNFVGGGGTPPTTVDSLVFYENFEPAPLGSGNTTIGSLTGAGGWTNGSVGANVWIVNNAYICNFLGISNTPDQTPITNHAGGLTSYYLHINATILAAICPQATFEAPGGGAVSSITTPVINTTNITGVTVSYWYLSRGGGGAPQSAGWAEYSVNGGTTWQPLNPAEYVNVNNWTEASFTHNGAAYNFDNQPNLRLRFRWRTGQAGNDPPLSLDDIRVRGVYEQPGTGGVPAEPGVYTCPLPSPVCPGAQMTVNFTGIVSGGDIFGANDAFTVQLSDADGDFSNPTVLGVTDAPGFGGNPQDSVYSGQMTVSIPNNAAPGVGYRIRVVSNNPNTNNNFPDNGADIVVLSQALTTPELDGPTSVCPGALGAIYTITNAVAMTPGGTVTWELVPNEAGVLTPQGTSASVQWINGTTATVRVRYDYACGSVSDEVQVTILPAAPNSPQITGPNAVCAGQTAVYSVVAQENTTYTWTVSGGNVTAGAGTNQISVQWDTPGNGFVQISLSNACGGPIVSGLTVNVQPGPPTTLPISVGEDTVCAGQSVYYLSATEAQIYEWRIEPQGAGTVVNGGQFAEITWANTPVPVDATVFFRPRNSCGAGDEVSFDVHVEAAASFCAFTPNPAGIGAPVTLSFTATGAGGPWEMNFTLQTETGDSTGSLTVLDGVVYPYDLFTRAFNQEGTYAFTYSATNGRCVVTGTCELTVTDFLITALNPEPDTVCLSATTNGAFNLSYQASAEFNEGNGLHIEISDAQGNFSDPPIYVTAMAPTPYPTIAASGTVPGLIPGTFEPGVYSIRIVSTDPPATSNFVNITVAAPPAPGVVTALPPVVCATGNESIMLTISGHSGQVLRWESSTDDGTTWVALPASASPEFVAPPVTMSTTFRAVTQKQPCDTVTASVTVQVSQALPPIQATVDKSVVCIGESVVLDTYIQGIVPLSAYQWQRSINGGDFENIPGGDLATLNLTPTQTADYRLVVRPLPPNVCAADTSATVAVRVDLPPTAGTVALSTPEPICTPGNFEIVASGGTGKRGWESSVYESGVFLPETGEGETLRVSNKAVGRYWYRVIATSDVCPDTARSEPVLVEVFPSPTANFSTPKTILYLPEDRYPVFTDASVGDIETYEWDFGNGQTYSGRNLPPRTPMYTDSGTYTVKLTVRTFVGCEHDTSVTIRVEDGEFVTAPNIFTPNGDGVNDVWAPKVSGFKEYTILIYDRWGTLVRRLEHDGVKVWDGKTSGGQLSPDGVYVFQFEGVLSSDLRKFWRSGNITLAR